MASSDIAPVSAQTYTDAEKTEIQQWSAKADSLKADAANPPTPGLVELNSFLATRTTVLGAKPSAADVALYGALGSAVRSWTPEQRTGKEGLPHIVRHLDFVQNSPAVFEVNVADADKIVVDPEEILYVKPPVDAKAEKERLKKEKAAAAAAAAGGGDKKLAERPKKQKGGKKEGDAAAEGAAAAGAAAAAEGDKKFPTQKKEKKEKKPKAPAPAAAPKTPALIDLRVGHILKAEKHPEADSLYVSRIAMGDPAGFPDTEELDGQVVRTVCSGLNGLVPLEDMQGRRVVAVCNLKPVKMRGIKSAAMILAASPRLAPGEEDHHAGPIDLVNPPPEADAPTGTRLFFEGYQGEPEKQLNPKKKVWETFQPGFTTTDGLEVAFDASAVPELENTKVGRLVTAGGAVCTVKSLKGATVR